MDASQIRQFRKMLLEQQQAIDELSLDAASGTDTVELDQTRMGRLTRMDALQNQQMNLAAQKRRADQARRIGEALKRLDTGDFGRCVECDEWINPRRLELDPSIDCCINCAD